MSQLFASYMEYIMHPEIYARHIPTESELEMLKNHPVVKAPPADLSKYGGGKMFSE